MLTQAQRPSSRHKSAVTRRRSRALNCAILETLEPRTLLSGLDFGGGFANTGDITLNGGAAISGSQLQISGASASAWSTAPRDITQFATSFTFQSVGAPGNFTFTLQGNSNTATGGGLDRTVSFMFDLSHGITNMFENGNGNNGWATTGLDFANNHIFNVTLTNPIITGRMGVREVITDMSTGATFSNDFNDVDIPGIIGSGGAYVGFAGGGFIGSPGAQNILSWTFNSPTVGNTPFAPSYMVIANYPNQNILRWTDNSANEDGFVIQRALQQNGNTPTDSDYSDLATAPANVTTYTDSGLTNGAVYIYHYRVRAFNAAGSSAESNDDNVTGSFYQPAPYGATATAVTPNQVNLTWQQDNSWYYGAYPENQSSSVVRIYRRTGGTGDFSLIGMQLGTVQSFSDTRAPSGTALEYHIVHALESTDYSHLGESGFADVTVTTPTAAVDVFGPAITLNGSAHLVNGSLALTDNHAGSEAGSAFSSQWQATGQFTTQFTFRITNPDVGGFTFDMQGSDYGPNKLGEVADLGFDTVGQSNGANPVAVAFYLGGPEAGALPDTGQGGGSTGMLPDMDYRFGTNVGDRGSPIDVTSSGIDFRSGHVFNVTLSYDRRFRGTLSGILNETIVDATTGATFQHAYWIGSFPYGGLDYVGFTGSKPATSLQGVDILSWSFSTNDPSNPTTTFLAAPVAVASSLSATAAGTYGGTSTLTAELQANGTPIAGALISFSNTSNVPIGNAITNASGIATLTNVSLAGINAGTYAKAYDATFAGDAYNLPSSAAASLLVTKADAFINISGFTGTYTATPHGATGTAIGVGGVDLSAQLSLGASFTNAPGGVATWSFAGGSNYNNASGTVNIAIAKAALSGIATTQDALNIAKQGSFTIDVNSILGLQGTDALAAVFSGAIFSLTIGTNAYNFAPTVTVDAASQTLHITYSLKSGTASADTLRADLLALDAADGTVSTSAAKTAYSTMWITASSLNYFFTDDFLTRLFSSK